MKKLLLVLPLLALGACEGSIANAVSKAGHSSFKGGTEIGTSDSDPGEFDGLSLLGPDNVVFTTGSDFSIRAEGDSDAIEELRYKITDGQLKIGRESEGRIWNGKDDAAVVYVSAPSLKNAKLAGSGDMKVDKMSGESAKLSVAGSGSINIEKMTAESLSTKIAGSGNLKVAGNVESASISVAGSGNLKGKKLNADKVTVKVAGSGNVALSSDGSVEAKVLGSGNVRIHGDAKCESKAMGSGKVNCG